MPAAPQLNAYVNAFTPPQQKGLPQTAMQPMMPPNMIQPVGYNPMMPTQGYPGGPNPMFAQQMMYQQMMQPPMMPYGYRPGPGMMYPYPPMMPPPNGMMNPMASSGPALNFARQYTGPQPPNPFMANPQMQSGIPYGGVQPVGYQQPMVAPQYQAAMQVEHLFRMMRESPYPSQREMAAQSLVGFDWRTNPRILDMLLAGAAGDPAPSVRLGCIGCLGRIQAAVPPVLDLLNKMRADPDPRVRQEAEQTLGRLGQLGATARAN